MRAQRSPHPTRRALMLAAAVVLLFPLLPNPMVAAGEPQRIGTDQDPVVSAIELNQARTAGPDGEQLTSTIVLGRSDVFADNLAATALAGPDGAVLFTDGGPQASLRGEVIQEIERTMPPFDCADGGAGTIFLAGGVNAVSQAVEDELRQFPYCVERLDGPSRVETAVAIAERISDPSDTVLLARSDNFADAGSIGSFAATTRSRILVTPTDQLHPAVAAALQEMAPAEIVLLGGDQALSDTVLQQAEEFAPTRRVSGPTRDTTAVAFARELWGTDLAERGSGVALADGFADDDWTRLFAGAAYAAQRGMPILYTNEGEITPGTAEYLSAEQPYPVVVFGAAPASDVALSDVRIGLETVVSVNQPLMVKPRPGTDELWIIERRGSIQALGPDGLREVLDISSTVSANGERGLLGLAFSPDGDTLYTSSTDNAGDSVLDEFQITDGVADVSTRREIIEVDQPASNHNGGDLVWGPDDYLYWALGDGGASDDRFGNGQNTGTLLGGIVRLDVTGAQPYTVPPDNPFVDGGGAPELWAYGLRNPWRIAFDPETDDFYIGDVGQDRIEEIDFVPAGTGGGRNYGWPVFEGSRPFAGSSLADHTPPILEESHAQGNCSITGGVVYRGNDIPELDGVYLYSDICRSSIRGLIVGDDGTVIDQADLDVRVSGGSPVGFGVDHRGEVLVLSLSGDIAKIVPA